MTLAAGCTDIGLPGGGTVGTADLVILPLQSTAPAPAPATLLVPNDRTVVRQLLHPDAFNTPFLELRFSGGSLVEVNGSPVGATDSVTVIVQPSSGRYGVTLSPSSLVMDASDPPTVRFFYGQYGDLTVSSGTFASPDAYANALALWRELTPGQWERVSGSGPSGVDIVSGPVTRPGTYIVAALP